MSKLQIAIDLVAGYTKTIRDMSSVIHPCPLLPLPRLKIILASSFHLRRQLLFLPGSGYGRSTHLAVAAQAEKAS